MRSPSRYTASEIAGWHVSEEFEPGRRRPARPCPIYRPILSWENWRQRLTFAWRVFTGRCDILDWEPRSGEWKNDQIAYRDITDKRFIRAGVELR